LPSEIWLAPFIVPLAGVEVRGADPLSVRVRNTGGMGGVWKPVHLILSDRELTDQQLHALIALRQRKTSDQ